MEAWQKKKRATVPWIKAGIVYKLSRRLRNNTISKCLEENSLFIAEVQPPVPLHTEDLTRGEVMLCSHMATCSFVYQHTHRIDTARPVDANTAAKRKTQRRLNVHIRRKTFKVQVKRDQME